MSEPRRDAARQLAQQFLEQGNATGWFEALYDSAACDASNIPWADLRVNPHFAEWMARQAPPKHGARALVVGCGLGDDAEELARRGWSVVAFDISKTAIEWCRRRFPASRVDYRVANLLHPPAEWQEAFDFVLEIYTLQSLPTHVRFEAIARIAAFVRARGTLLVIARGREPTDEPGSLPWPLTKDEINQFVAVSLELVSFDDYVDGEQPPVRRFRAVLRRVHERAAK